MDAGGAEVGDGLGDGDGDGDADAGLLELEGVAAAVGAAVGVAVGRVVTWGFGDCTVVPADGLDDGLDE